MDGATRPKFISVSVGPIMSGRSMRELLTRHIASLIVRCRRLSWRQCCGSIQTCWTRLSSASRMTSPATYHEHWSYHAPLTYDCTTYCSSSTVRNIDLSSSIGVGCGGEVLINDDAMSGRPSLELSYHVQTDRICQTSVN